MEEIARTVDLACSPFCRGGAPPKREEKKEVSRLLCLNCNKPVSGEGLTSIALIEEMQTELIKTYKPLKSSSCAVEIVGVLGLGVLCPKCKVRKTPRTQ